MTDRTPIEEKRLGRAVHETAISGGKKVHREYARIIRLDGGDNVEIMNFVTKKKSYLFPEPVIPTIAKREYDGLI